MKKILSFIAFALAIGVQAQTKDSIDAAQFAVIYDYSVNTLDDEGEAVCDSIQLVVQVGQTVTKSQPLMQYIKEKGKDIEGDGWKTSMAMEHKEALVHMPTVWINYPEGEILSRDIIFPHTFEGHEPIPQMEWNLTDDTLTISGYLCHRAEMTFRGVRWEAWYTEEIPSSTGPWRLRGLPGIIVKAEGDAHRFVLAELRREATPITYTPSVDVERMEYSKLLKYRNQIFGSKQYAKNPYHHIGGNGTASINQYINNITVIGNKYIYANGLPFLQKAHVHQPLELK